MLGKGPEQYREFSKVEQQRLFPSAYIPIFSIPVQYTEKQIRTFVSAQKEHFSQLPALFLKREGK
ncbi:MAG: hypothetical protein H6765_03160 [Candidatus Peribacteria bacterium]|nr:MAG: hypothetical protein H6765_03160 [Candidatus Peribacteria bacterium]